MYSNFQIFVVVVTGVDNFTYIDKFSHPEEPVFSARILDVSSPPAELWQIYSWHFAISLSW